MELKLYTLGEIIDNINFGKMAISVSPDDNGTILIMDNEGWLMIKYPHNDYFQYDINFLYSDSIKEKRWAIMDAPEDIFEEVEETE